MKAAALASIDEIDPLPADIRQVEAVKGLASQIEDAPDLGVTEAHDVKAPVLEHARQGE